MTDAGGSGAPVVDIHAHLVPRGLVEEVRRHGAALGMRMEPLSDGRERIVFDDGPALRPLFPALCDEAERVAAMARAGIDVQVLSTWTDMAGEHLAERSAVAWARLQNDALADVARLHAGRFVAMGTLPLPHVGASCEELRRCVEQLGMRAALVTTNAGGRETDDEDLRALWALACDLGVLVFLHPPGRQLGHERLHRNFLNNIVGNPAETTAAAVRLVLAGVPDSLPSLRCLLAHGGGYLPYQIGRVDRGHAAGATAPHHLGGMPSDALGWFYFDSILFDDAALAYLVARVGPDHVVLGTDQPFEMRDDDALERVRRGALDAPARRAILGETAWGLLGGRQAAVQGPAQENGGNK